MSHDLMITHGEAAMMYVGRAPWHELGTALDCPPTAQQGIVAAGLNWRVSKKSIGAMENGIWHQVAGQYAVVRDDLWGNENCPVFGIVGEDYVPLQNEEAFAFFDPLVGKGQAVYETAGALGQGERVWVMARLTKEFRVGKDDLLLPYILLANGHNARTAVRAALTPVRVVCQNTLTCALKTTRSETRIHHDSGMHRKIREVAESISRVIEQYDELVKRFGSMASFSMTGNLLANYLDECFPIPPKGNRTDYTYEQLVSEIKARQRRALDLFETGAGNSAPDIRGSLWAAYNGVTDWTDHQMQYSNRFQRFSSMFFGEANRIKTRALAGAFDLLGLKRDAENLRLGAN